MFTKFLKKLSFMFHQPTSDAGCYQQSIFSLQHSFVNPVESTISRHDGVQNVPPRLMKLLILLVINNRKTVSREQILAELWPNTVVTDESINRAVADLRKILGDSPSTSNIIKTVTKQGYKLTLEPIFVKGENKGIKKISSYGLISISLAFLVLALWQFNVFLPKKNTKENIQYTESRLATTGTLNRYPNINKSGNLLVSEKLEDGKHTLWLYDLASDTEKQLFSNSNEDLILPAISNDSAKLAYMRTSQDPITYAMNCKLEIYHLILDTTKELSDCDFYSGADLSWAPNDDKLLSSRLNKATNLNELVFIDVQTGESSFVFSPDNETTVYRFPRLSPSGKFIALLERNGISSKLAVLTISSMTIQYITTHSHNVRQVAWGKSDEVLFYSELSGVNTGLWQVDLSTQQQKLLVNKAIVDFDYNVLNNTFIASVARYASSIKRIQNGVKSVIIDDDAYERGITTSQNGELLAYVSNRNGDNNIWMKSLVSNELHRITNDKVGDYINLSFSTDNRYLSYLVMENMSSVLVILDINNNFSEVYRQLDVQSAAWSKNSQSIYTYGKSIKNEIFKVSLIDFNKVIVTNTDDLYRIEVSSSDQLIVQEKAHGTLSKWCCLDDEYIHYSQISLEEDWIYNWNMHDEYVSVLDWGDGKKQVLKFYSLDGKEIKSLQLTIPSEKRIFYYSFNLKTNTLYYSNMKFEEFSLIKLEKVMD